MVAINKILLSECTGEGCGGETGTCRDSRVHRRNAENRAPATRSHCRTQPLVDNLYQGMTLDTVTGLYYERNRDYSPSLGRWMEQDPAQYINGANTYQFVDSSPVGANDPSGEYWGESWVNGVGSAIRTVGSTVADATGINGGAVAGAFWTGAAQGAQGGSSIVADTLTFGGTDNLGITDSAQCQGGAYSLSRDFTQAGRTGLEMAATGGLSEAAMSGAEAVGAGTFTQALTAGGASAIASGGFQSLNNIGAGQSWNNDLASAMLGGLLGGGIGGWLSAFREANLAARQAAMSFGEWNLARNFAEMNPQFARDAASEVALENFGFDLAKEIVGELSKLGVEGFSAGAGSQAAPCKDSR